MDLNRVSLLGRLTRDPEVRSTSTGKTVTSITIATGRAWKNDQGVKQERSEFHNCVLWGKLGEIAGQYLAKGRKVFFEGRLETRDWTGQDGVKRYRTEIIGDNLIMLDGNGNKQRAEDEKMFSKDNKQEDIKVEDIPF